MFEVYMCQVSNVLNEQLLFLQQDFNCIENQLIGCFCCFIQQWLEELGDFIVLVVLVEDFFVCFEWLECDGLLQYEECFFDLLQNQSKNNLLVLQCYSVEVCKLIGQCLDEVNVSLEQVLFNCGMLLIIELSDCCLLEVVEFYLQLCEVLLQQQIEQCELVELQFIVLCQLVNCFGLQEGEDKCWCELVLDVCMYVEFIGVELDVEMCQQVEIYCSGVGKFGGQCQKLVIICLVVVLCYQFGGVDSQLFSYVVVVFDEVFDKVDNEFIVLVMNIFDNFGFQMVVVILLKLVMMLELFIGGVCFVEISGCYDLGVLLIEYDEEGKCLKLFECSCQQVNELEEVEV